MSQMIVDLSDAVSETEAKLLHDSRPISNSRASSVARLLGDSGESNILVG